MKVKDAINIWLLVWRKSPSGKQAITCEHYFADKKRSLCGMIKHPTTQPVAAFIQHDTCKRCKAIFAKQGESK